ncbi:hypothetical protein [Pseudoduganella sp. R-34]|uniref:hypothetical protein n=1 Tax=unclassified Pseudoduganella TaxID=2637179 RepID=UPI003CEFF15D
MPYRTPRWRIVAGIVISLLLHLAAVIFVRLPEPRNVADSRTWLTKVEVRIVAPPEPPEPKPEAQSKPERVAAAEPRRQPRRAEPRKNAVKEESELAIQPARTSTLVLSPAEPGAAPHFDRETAKAAARDIAGELESAPLKMRETRDEKLARQIQNAARPNCKDGIPGGLLAPLYLMMDKKDSGCKW